MHFALCDLRARGTGWAVMNLKRLIPAAGFVISMFPSMLLADGKVMPPVDYKGSLEEKSQEAIIVFQPGSETKSARQDMILKITVKGESDSFAWVIRTACRKQLRNFTMPCRGHATHYWNRRTVDALFTDAVKPHSQ